MFGKIAPRSRLFSSHNGLGRSSVVLSSSSTLSTSLCGLCPGNVDQIVCNISMVCVCVFVCGGYELMAFGLPECCSCRRRFPHRTARNPTGATDTQTNTRTPQLRWQWDVLSTPENACTIPWNAIWVHFCVA